VAGAFYVTIVGTKQGKLETSETGSKPHAGKIHGLDFSYHATREHGPVRSGSAGSRTHGPVVMTKAWDSTTPLLFMAFVHNEKLSSVLFEFVSIGSDGTETIFHTIELEDALVSGVSWYLADEEDRRGDRLELEDVSFTFNQIRVENVAGGTVAADSWLTI
jgi:type VI secretion system secreted protein Hcp